MIDIATYREAFAEIDALQDEGVAFFGPSFSGEGIVFDRNKLQVEVLLDEGFPTFSTRVPKPIFRVTRWFGDSFCRWVGARLAADVYPQLPTLKQAVAMQRLPQEVFPSAGSLHIYKNVACTVTWTKMCTLTLVGLGFVEEVPLHRFLIAKGILEGE